MLMSAMIRRIRLGARLFTGRIFERNDLAIDNPITAFVQSLR